TVSAVEVRRRLKLAAVVGAVDELAAVPTQRMDRSGQPGRRSDDDLRRTCFCPDEPIAGQRIDAHESEQNTERTALILIERRIRAEQSFRTGRLRPQNSPRHLGPLG